MKKVLLFVIVMASLLTGGYFSTPIIGDKFYLSGVKSFEQKHYESALKKFNWAGYFKSLRSTDLSHLYDRALTFEKLARYSEAENDYNRLIDLSEGTEVALLYEKRATLYQKTGRLANATEDITKSLQGYKTEYKFKMRSELYFELKEYDKAISDCIQANIEPSDDYVKKVINFCNQIADSTFSIEAYEQSIKYWEYIRALDPSLNEKLNSKIFDGHQRLGDLHFQKGQYYMALTQYEKIYTLRPPANRNKIVVTLTKLGQREERRGNLKTAARYYSEILNYDPSRRDFVNTRLKVIDCFYIQEKLDQANAYADKIDFSLLRRVDVGIKDLLENEAGEANLALYITQLGRLKEDAYQTELIFGIDPYEFERAINMVNSWREAHRRYKKVMDIAEKGKCSGNVGSLAFKANADMMTQWIISTPNLMRILAALADIQ
jgi:tetratricopeptide (TPR) repeat protein